MNIWTKNTMLSANNYFRLSRKCEHLKQEYDAYKKQMKPQGSGDGHNDNQSASGDRDISASGSPDGQAAPNPDDVHGEQMLAQCKWKLEREARTGLD